MKKITVIVLDCALFPSSHEPLTEKGDGFIQNLKICFISNLGTKIFSVDELSLHDVKYISLGRSLYKKVIASVKAKERMKENRFVFTPRVNSYFKPTRLTVS